MRSAFAALALTLVAIPAAQALPSTRTPGSTLTGSTLTGSTLSGLTLSGLTPTGTPDKGTHKDERYGFSFKPPKSWKSIALKTDEGWLAAKYLSDKSYFYTDDTGWTNEHQPEVMVIAFQHANQKRKKEVTEEEEDGVTVTTVVINNPYKDYEDFLDRTYAGGGWFVDKKTESKHGKIAVTKYEVKVEKLSRSGPKRIVTWIYHTEDIDFAVQIEVLEPEYKKLRKLIDRTHKSFKEIERNGDLLPKSGATGGSIRFTRRDLTSGDPKERRTKRMTSQRDLHDKAVAGLPDDWDHEYHGDVLILNHNQDKWSKRIGQHAEMFLKWTESTFPYIGQGEYARSPVIRVCEDQEEENAFSRGVASGSGGNMVFVFPGSEITTHKDDEGFIGFEVGWVNRMILSLWLADKDEDLASAMPEWIRLGLNSYVDGARADGRKMKFRMDEWSKDASRLAVAQGKADTPRNIVRYTREEFRSDSGGALSASSFYGRGSQASMLVRYLLSKECSRCKQAKGLLEEYITTLKDVVEEVKEKENDTWDSSASPETEAEEEEMAKARATRWSEREKELMEETFERVFGDWTEKDWAAFEKAFFDWL